MGEGIEEGPVNAGNFEDVNKTKGKEFMTIGGSGYPGTKTTG